MADQNYISITKEVYVRKDNILAITHKDKLVYIHLKQSIMESKNIQFDKSDLTDTFIHYCKGLGIILVEEEHTDNFCTILLILIGLYLIFYSLFF